MFKFEIGQVIFYLMENRVHSAQVVSRVKVENQKDADKIAHTPEQISFYKPFGDEVEKYSTCHGIIDGAKAFNSKEELLASL